MTGEPERREGLDPAGLTVEVVSFYMDNIAAEVVAWQRAVLDARRPQAFAFEQILTRRSHGEAIDEYVAGSAYDVIVIIDIDCVPLRPDALSHLVSHAARGELIGCVQRANHIQNGAHLYVAPFCMAFSKSLFEEIGRPSFRPTDRGDVGEELTYACTAAGRKTRMLWPSFVESARWDLTEGRRFGPNTEYAGLFFHAFEIRSPANQERFVARCRAILAKAAGGAEPASTRCDRPARYI
jgi:hypothetical protein